MQSEVTFLPTPKVATGGLTGILAAFVLYELSSRFKITLAPEEAVFISTVLSVITSYFAPHSAPTPEQIAEIKKQP